MDDSNRREMTRVPLQVGIALRSSSKPAIPGKTTDVSLKGVHIACENPLPVGSTCQLTLFIGPEDDPVRITFGGTVVRADRNGMAVEIDDVLPIDTLTHLQNIVRYNATDANRINQELRERVSQRWSGTAPSAIKNKPQAEIQRLAPDTGW